MEDFFNNSMHLDIKLKLEIKLIPQGLRVYTNDPSLSIDGIYQQQNYLGWKKLVETHRNRAQQKNKHHYRTQKDNFYSKATGDSVELRFVNWTSNSVLIHKVIQDGDGWELSDKERLRPLLEIQL